MELHRLQVITYYLLDKRNPHQQYQWFLHDTSAVLSTPGKDAKQ